MPQLWDGSGLLSDYASWAPDYVLVVPMESAHGRAHHSHGLGNTVGHSVSESSIMTSDGHKTISQTTRCKDGNCRTSNSTTNSTLGAGSDLLSTHENTEAQQNSLAHSIHAMKRLSHEMDRTSDIFGRDFLKDSLDTIFDETKREHVGSDDILDWDKSFGRLPLEDHMGSMAEASSSQSMSSETHVENGKRVTNEKICKNGHCKTVVTTEDIVDESPNSGHLSKHTSEGGAAAARNIFSW